MRLVLVFAALTSSSSFLLSPLPPPHLSRPSLSSLARSAKSKPAASPVFVEIEDIGHSAWRLDSIAETLREGGLGIIPTDTSYAFVTSIESRDGVSRLYELKQQDSIKKKPFSILCDSISQISKYTTAINFKSVFKMLKEVLPGPYTFICPSTNDLPRMIIDHKKHAKIWKRKEIGVRIPKDEVCLQLIGKVGTPLLCAGVHKTDEESYSIGHVFAENENLIDFMVAAGERNAESSTIVDLTKEPAVILREGAGNVEVLRDFIELSEE